MPTLRTALCSLALLAFATTASAANFTVNPMQIALSPAVRSAVVTLHNTSKEELRFQISAFEWDQDDKGGMKLTPSTALIVFPQLLTLAPGAQRQVRVGTDSKATGPELSFRIFFEELPVSTASPHNGVTMRTKVGLPVFVRPAGTLSAAMQIHDLRAGDGKITMDVKNDGQAHGVVDNVHIVAADAAGKTVYTKDVPGWYVLAHRSTRYEVPVTGAGCSAASFTANVVTGGKTITDQWKGTVPGCK